MSQEKLDWDVTFLEVFSGDYPKNWTANGYSEESGGGYWEEMRASFVGKDFPRMKYIHDFPPATYPEMVRGRLPESLGKDNLSDARFGNVGYNEERELYYDRDTMVVLDCLQNESKLEIRYLQLNGREWLSSKG